MDQSFFYLPERSSKKWKTIALTIGILSCISLIIVFHNPSPKTSFLSEYEFEESEFKKFIALYSKSYKSQSEYKKRFKIFRDNLNFIRYHNQLKKSWYLGLNEFTDMSMEEFHEKYLSRKFLIDPKTDKNPSELIGPDESVELPTSVDWVTAGAVTKVKNQGQCEASWAFSATGAIEGAWKIAGHKLTSLSEQQLIDCSAEEGNNGCYGGIMIMAFEYVIINGGITSESEYPFTGQNESCKNHRAKNIVAKISSFDGVSQDSSSALLNAIARQPISVAVDANQIIWQFYSGGVIGGECGTNLNHAVLAVGFDTSENYYLIKNSWGANWGMKGYAEIGITDGVGTCGIQMMPSYPIV